MRIAVSAGELSGDEHGALMVQALRTADPRIEIGGMGLRNLREAGVEMIVDAEKSGAIMGFTEAVAGLGKALKALSLMKAFLGTWRPDVLVIINYSEFNLALARFAKREGIKVLFYIPPQVWAWRASRVKTIDRFVDVVATIYPFEREFYEQRGCSKVVYVGHPFAGSTRFQPFSPAERRERCRAIGLDPDRPVIALFPGSRRKEVQAHTAFMVETMRRLSSLVPGAQGLIVSARDEWTHDLGASFGAGADVRAVHGDSVELLGIADAGLIKSGTSNLQAVFKNVPFVMYYKTSHVTGFLIRRLAPRLTQYSIVNILRSDTVREIAGERLDPAAAAEELHRILSDSAYRAAMLAGFAKIREALAAPDFHPAFEGCASAAERLAALVTGLGRDYGAR